MKKQSEKEITAKIRNLLNIVGCWHWKHWQGTIYSPMKGISDILGIWRGRFLAIEVKKEGWKPPEPSNTRQYDHYLRQKEFIDRINREGGIGFFATCCDDVIKELGLGDRFLF